MTGEDIDRWFVYHTPLPGQAVIYAELRASAKEFAELVMFYTPEGVEKDRAIAALREAVMWTNAGIACEARR